MIREPRRTVEDDGTIVWADMFGQDARDALGVGALVGVRGLAQGHRPYPTWHRENVFREDFGRPG